jgi:hypothetical protein
MQTQNCFERATTRKSFRDGGSWNLDVGRYNWRGWLAIPAHTSSSGNSGIYVDTMPVRKKPCLHETIKSCNWKEQILKPEDTVELSSGDFLFIKSIIQEQQSIVLSGLLFEEALISKDGCRRSSTKSTSFTTIKFLIERLTIIR